MNVKEVLLVSVLIFSSVTVIITEITSALKILNFNTLLGFWIGFSLLIIINLYSKKRELINFTTFLKQNVKNNFYELNKIEKVLFFCVILILTLTFIQGIAYPPNNWDSMTYHMARIPHWISHQSIVHYPTHIVRQLYQPPFSGIVIMHFNILNNGDYFSNSVQLFFLVFSLFAVVSIVELMGLNRQFKLISIVLSVSIPEVILQASSTQNDIIVSFFILTSIYFAVKSFKKVIFQNYLFLGLSVGLGLLVKGTAYIYLSPVLFVFALAILFKLNKSKNYKYIRYSILAALVCVSLNLGHYIRNYSFSNNILGIDNTESKFYSNENMSPALLISNIVKNAGLHIGPYPINIISNKIIGKLHLAAGVEINNSETNFMNISYAGAPKIPIHEDNASNSIHFFLIILSFILMIVHVLKNKESISKLAFYLGIIIVLEAILFCLYLKWQPWHTRLHTPLFMVSVPLICYAISLNGKYKRILNKTIPIILLYALLIILFNSSRPFLSNRFTKPISILDTRDKKYFANRLYFYDEYNVIIENLETHNYKNIGLILGVDDWEYPLFTQSYGKEINPIHIIVSNITKDISLNIHNIDCIISTTINDTVIDYNGKYFYNQNTKNNVIWLYK